jgi:hypothetical protein
VYNSLKTLTRSRLSSMSPAANAADDEEEEEEEEEEEDDDMPC